MTPDRTLPLTSPLPLVLAASLALLTVGLVPMAGAQGSTATVTLDDQTIGGHTLTVDSVNLPDGGFIAIHDASLQDGHVLSSVVGASAFLVAGTHEDVTVHLDKPLTEDTTLIAMPHKDTDNDRVYSFVADGGTEDGPFTAGGDPVVDPAEITVSATVEFSDQPTDQLTVNVDATELAEGGFVAIHDARLLSGEPLASVIGVSDHLKTGSHEDVRIELDRSVMEEQPLIAMPHRDSDDDGTYDFVTSGGSEDGPYTNASGNAVIDDATVTPSSTATATFDDQSTGGTTLVVASAFLPDGGFVTMHDSTLAGGKTFDSVRGTSACLDPGLHRSIVIQLDDPLTSDEQMIAMPHKDTDSDCTYDFVTSDGSDDGPYQDDDGIVTDAGETTVSASISYSAQSSDGRTITVDLVDMAEGGFIAVHDPSLLGGAVLDSVVGHSGYLAAGPHEDVEITLETPIRTSQTLIPMPHKDSDGDETYDFVTSEGDDDGPHVFDGSAVVDTAHTSVLSTVTLEAQSSGGTVTVASATLHDGGFVTLHDGTLLEGKVLESVVGVSEALAPGTHEGIEITVDDPPEGQATLIAMPHYDTNGNEVYDFVTSEGSEDGPYVAAGGAVVDSANIAFSQDASDGGDGGDAGPGTGDDGTGGDGASQDAMPGFGAVAALTALAGLAVALTRRRA